MLDTGNSILKTLKNRVSAILWDFDGVIIDSMPVRTDGFAKVLSEYPNEQVEELLEYHKLNGGKSRFVKFRYFFEIIRSESISEENVLSYADKFSSIMVELLTNKEFLIKETVEFIRSHYNEIPMHVVSGSEENELRFLCRELGLESFFKTISGSPTEKSVLVSNVICEFNYNKSEVVLIGDSINDYDAATSNGIDFYGFNNPSLKSIGAGYIARC